MDTSYSGKKILILGLGVNQGGVGAAKFFAKNGAEVRVTDLKSRQDLKSSIDKLKNIKNIEYILGQHRFEDIDWADLIIRNPALKQDNPYLVYAREKGKRIETDMGIFLQFVNPKQIIGITGTKGKSTTASLIYEILLHCHPRLDLLRQQMGSSAYRGSINNAKRMDSRFRGNDKEERVIFAGNIGKSVLDTIPQIKIVSLVVLEISSFQLEAFAEHKVSPKWAVITNIYPDHLNYYPTMQSYINSKKPIARYQLQDDFVFLKKNDQVIHTTSFQKGFRGTKVYFDGSNLPKKLKTILLGDHNKDNIDAAVSVTETLNISRKVAMEVAARFSGVEYRLQKIYDKKGIKIYNDSAATNPDATIQALKSLPSSILIVGGVNKNLPYKNLAKAIDKYAKSVYLLEGDATDKMISLIKNKFKVINLYRDLNKLLTDIKEKLEPNDVILFSPGAASFNLFQNESDRGKKFNQAVAKLFK